MPSLFSVDDYPPEAVAKGWGGTVGVELQISKQGSVAGCRILQSSSYPVLDNRTCEILTQRARFKPARNNRGEAMPDTFFTRITWALEDPEPEIPTEPKP